MATDLQSNIENINLTQYYGGSENGPMIQVTQSGQERTPMNQFGVGYIQLTESEVLALAEQLLSWVNGNAEPAE